MRRFVCAVLVTLTTALACVPQASPQANSRDNMRGARYGEVLVVDGGPARLKAHVYNTIGLSDCPEAKWKKLDANAIKKQFKAWAVVLNGPRYFLMNRAASSRKGDVVDIGELQFHELATVDLSALTVLEGTKSKPYVVRVVNRTTDFLFNKANRVYELVDSRGNVYAMQSYALIVDPNLTEPDLEKLARRLHLPKGWSYRTRVLDADMHVRANGQAHVVQDELENTYQREEN